jgi:beta-galactosidase
VRLEEWSDLRIEGYLKGKLVASKTLPGNDTDRELRVEPDDSELVGDGIDMTRVLLRVNNEYGGRRPFATGAVSMSFEGPGEIIGENPFALAGGVGAVWVKTKIGVGIIRLHARHPYLGSRSVTIRVKPADAEPI